MYYNKAQKYDYSFHVGLNSNILHSFPDKSL